MCRVRWLKRQTVTSAPQCHGHLSSQASSSRTLLLNAALIYETPTGSLCLSVVCFCVRAAYFLSLSLLFFFSPCPFLTHTLTYTGTTLILQGLVHGGGEKWLLSFFPLLSGALQRSLSQRPRGEDIKQRKNLSHFIVLYHRELISLSFTRLQSFFYSFHVRSIHPFLIFPRLRGLRVSVYIL